MHCAMIYVFIAVGTYISCTQAATTAIATFPIITVSLLTTYITRSSVTATNTSTVGGDGPPRCSTSTVSGRTQTACVDDPIALTVITLYGTSVLKSLVTVTSTIGYSTRYSNLPDLSSPSPSTKNAISSSPLDYSTTANSSTQSALSSTVTSIVVSDDTVSTSLVMISVTSSSSQAATTYSSADVAGSTSSANKNSSSDGLSIGLKAAIAVAVVLGVVFCVAAAVFLVKRCQRRKKEIERNTADFSTGAAVGRHEMSHESSHDHAAIAIAAANGRTPADHVYGKQGYVTNEASIRDQRFYKDYGSQAHELYGNYRFEANGNMRYETGPDRRLHALDGTGRRV